MWDSLLRLSGLMTAGATVPQRKDCSGGSTTIEVGNAILRPLEPSDLDRLYEFRNDIEVISQLGGFTTGYSRKDLSVANWIGPSGFLYGCPIGTLLADLHPILT